MSRERSASLVVRVWLEAGTGDFRARVTSLTTSPDDDGEVTVGVASSPGDVLAVVRTWLATFLDEDADLGGDGP